MSDEQPKPAVEPTIRKQWDVYRGPEHLASIEANHTLSKAEALRYATEKYGEGVEVRERK